MMITSNNSTNDYMSSTRIAEQSGFICVEEDGDLIYHWIDTAIEDLSSTKLWDILRLAKINDCHVDEAFTEQVIKELTLRNHFNEAKPWLKPH